MIPIIILFMIGQENYVKDATEISTAANIERLGGKLVTLECIQGLFTTCPVMMCAQAA